MTSTNTATRATGDPEHPFADHPLDRKADTGLRISTLSWGGDRKHWGARTRTGSPTIVPLLVALALIAVAVCSAGLLITRVDAERRATLTGRIESRHALAMQFVTAYVEGEMKHQRTVATATMAGDVSPEQFDRITLENGYLAAVLLDTTGLVVAVSPAAPEMLGRPLPAPYSALAGALDGFPMVSQVNVEASAALGEAVVAFAVPFQASDGLRVFISGNPVTALPLAAFTDSALSLRTSRVFLVDRADTIMTSSDSTVTSGADLEDFPELQAATRSSGTSQVDGEETYVVVGDIPGTPWRLVFTVESAVLLAPVSGPGRLVPWTILAGFTTASLAALAMWRRARREHYARVDFERQLRRLAMTDPLTGLANRRAVLDRLNQALARAKRLRTAVAVIYVDVDQFKAVNDGYGHAGGDAMLVAVADRLRATFRTEDLVARLGGDEFAVVCEDVLNPQVIDELAARTRAALNQPYLIGKITVPGSASVGLATAIEGESSEAVIARADRQMYDAKLEHQVWLAQQPSGPRATPRWA